MSRRFSPAIEPGAKIVAMIQFKDMVLLATEHYVYRLDEAADEFVAIEFREPPPDEMQS